MDKDIIEHYQLIKSALENNTLSSKEVESLEQFNEQRIRDFQHERLIHLLVTLFFGLLLLFFIASYFVVLSLFTLNLIHWPLLAIILLLLVTELFYVFHYYKLENGTQKLYSLRSVLREYKDYTNNNKKNT